MLIDSSKPNRRPSVASNVDALHAAARFFRVVRARRRHLVVAPVVATLLGLVYYFTATRIYRATATLWVTSNAAETWDPTSPVRASASDEMPSYERLLTSAAVLDDALERIADLPPDRQIDFADLPRDEWREALSEELSAQAVRRTNLIEVAFRSRDPEAGADVVRAVVDSYLDFVERHHKDVSVEVASMLNQEREGVERQLTEKQQHLLDVKRDVRDLGIRESADVVHPVVQRVVGLNNLIVEAEQERLTLLASLASLEAAVKRKEDLRHYVGAVEPLVGQDLMKQVLGVDAELQKSAGEVERRLIDDLARLDVWSVHLGPGHPERARLERSIHHARAFLENYRDRARRTLDETDNRQLATMLLAMMRRRLATAETQQMELRRQYERAENEAVSMNGRIAELQIAENELDRLRRLHDTLLDRISTIDIHDEHSDVRLAVVSEPRAADRPVAPRLSVVVLLCLCGGLGGGLAVIYVLDVLDDRFTSPEELSDQLGAPVLAIVYDLPSGSDTGIDAIQVHSAPTSVYSEAFRTIRTTLAFSGQLRERIAITSSEPGDGKTTVLANLAASFAQAGRRTLAIDADLRRPGLSKLLDMRGLSGLSEVLRGSEPLDVSCRQHLRATGIENFDVLPSGPRPHDPAELLTRSRLAELIAWAEQHYDQILIDCPPILAASDAAIVGRLVDGVVLVVRPDENHRRVVSRAATALATMKVPLAGIVANRVRQDRASSYGYGNAYGYSYGHDALDDGTDGIDADFLAVHSVVERADRVGVQPRRAA